MSCYLITLHTYASWLPDRAEGYVHWKRGLSTPNTALAACYREEQKESTVFLSTDIQKSIISEIVKASPLQRFRLHAVACEHSHVHILLSWRDNRVATALRKSLRYSLAFMLNRQERRRWFSRGGSLRRVRTQNHFDHLYYEYMPAHEGMKWREDMGAYH